MPPRSFAITVRAPSVSPIRILSFHFLFSFLNTDACDPKIEKEEKKTLRYRDENETDIERTTTGKFFFFSFFLRFGHGYEI